MKGIRDFRFSHRDYVDGTVRVEIKDDESTYQATIDYDALLYALRADLDLEVKE